MDLICPIGMGQRGLIVAPPGSGKTTFLKHICQSVSKSHPNIKLYCLLIDERPEEVTDFRRSVTAEVRWSSSDEAYEHHIETANELMKQVYREASAGENVMVLVDSLSDRHIVRIFDKDQKNVMTTILAIPNYRLTPTGNTTLEYWEVPAGQPRALRAWFYPGDNFGQEFAYPKQKAVVIAARVKMAVPMIEVETVAADDLKTVPLVAVDESGLTSKLVVVAPAPVYVAAQPAPEPVVVVAPVVTMEPVAQELPHTASVMPLLGLAGLISLALFAALGFKSRRACKV